MKGPFELFGNAPKQSGERFDVEFSIRGTWELNAHRNLLFSVDAILGDRACDDIELQLLTR